MSPDHLTATAQILINAPLDAIWNALVDPDVIKQYMFGTTVISDWEKGSSITWKGEMNGKAYEDKGEILEIIPRQKLQYSHVAGTSDGKENNHTVTITLQEDHDRISVKLTQNNNPTEAAKENSEKNWVMMLENLRKLLEGR